MGQLLGLQFVQLQLNYNYIVLGQLQLQLPIDMVKNFEIYFSYFAIIRVGVS